MDFCSVELFNPTRDEAQDRMLEKRTKLYTVELGPDLKTVQALQGRLQHPELELAPVEEKVYRENQLTDCDMSSYPNERKDIDVRAKEVQELSGKVTAEALQRCSHLEDDVDHQNFMNNSTNLVSNIVFVAASADTALSSGQF
jgi:hypothetical protein